MLGTSNFATRLWTSATKVNVGTTQTGPSTTGRRAEANYMYRTSFTRNKMSQFSGHCQRQHKDDLSHVLLVGKSRLKYRIADIGNLKRAIISVIAWTRIKWTNMNVTSSLEIFILSEKLSQLVLYGFDDRAEDRIKQLSTASESSRSLAVIFRCLKTISNAVQSNVS